jgi:hypothetical protein
LGDATNSKDTNDQIITLSPISITMVAVFVSRGSSNSADNPLLPSMPDPLSMLSLLFFRLALSREQYTYQQTATSRSTTVVSLSLFVRPPQETETTSRKVSNQATMSWEEAISSVFAVDTGCCRD